MNTTRYEGISFYARYHRQIKEAVIMASMLAFALIYSARPSVQEIVDAAVTPAVAGVTELYGRLSTTIYKISGLNLGFVTIPPDQDFLFSVRLATYINERRAAPLLDIAGDNRFTTDKRERSLAAILKFESATDWIQPFLNELPKGGLLGLYDDDAPLLSELIKKIRSEGGVRQPLVRAYAEVVFSFMLQVPDLVVRLHACKWVSDVVAEDALFLLIPRLQKEQDPKGREALERALFDIRAVSEPDTARDLLIPIYRKPPWPSLRLPLAVVLKRLGFLPAQAYLEKGIDVAKLPNDQRVDVSLALAGTLYPKELKISKDEAQLMAEHKAKRSEQLRLAMDRRERILKQEEVRRAVLARAEAERAAQAKAVAESKPEAEPVAPPAAPAENASKTVASALATAAKTQPAKQVAAVVPAAVPQTPKTPPKQFPIPGAGPEKEVPAENTAKADTQVAMLTPNENLPPPIEEAAPKSRSVMNYVDMVFEVKKQEAPLFQNPGEGPTGVMLPVGAKGKADFEFLIGEEHWYQVKSKKGSGWVSGKYLSMYSLSPTGSAPVATVNPQQGNTESMDAGRKESTYFETAIDDAPLFEKPSEKAKHVGTLLPEVAYLATKSEKVGSDRWFLLQIKAGETGWARGLDLRLADVQQPVALETATKEMSQRGKTSAFKAEWVKASVKGVGVYNRPSIAGKMLQQINPEKIFKVLEISAEGGEWYRIQLAGKKDGWVQAMDVNLTKKD